jgi:hypothetical protein
VVAARPGAKLHDRLRCRTLTDAAPRSGARQAEAIFALRVFAAVVVVTWSTFAAVPAVARNEQFRCPDAIALGGGPLNAGRLGEACVSEQRAFMAIDAQGPAPIRAPVWWRTDGGHHWYPTRRVGANLMASAGRVYWVSGATIYQLSSWPSAQRARAACRSFSWRGACLSPAFVDAGARSRPLLTLDGAAFNRDAFVVLSDRFIAPVLNTQTALPPRAVLVRGQSVRVINLPDVGWYVCGGEAAPTNRARIYISGCAVSGVGGLWISADAGVTWTTSEVSAPAP